MSFPAGNYTIQSISSNSTYLLPSAIIPAIFPPVPVAAFVRNPLEGESLTWIVGSDGTITGNYGTIVVQNNTLFVNPQGDGDQFSIEQAGEGVWRVHIPNQDAVWTWDNDTTSPVTVAPDVGDPSQRWVFNSIEDLD